ncbi:hypothetical protein ABRP17_012955 [Stenotrophomonas sp. WHRI 8082]|uniref:hypothetical protein n=1 Tax=Stenotrophomonas sp. WHRI 8082 TaxID=3162571 RepID=UPI0032EE4ABE
MKLISKQHDYYDTVLAYGRDESIVYVREPSRDVLPLPGDLLPWAVADKYGGPAGPRAAVVFETHHPQYPYWQRHGHHILPESASLSPYFHEAFLSVAGKVYPIWVDVSASRHDDPAAVGVCGTPSLESYRAVVMDNHARYTDRDPHEIAEVEVEIFERERDVERRYENVRDRLLAHDFTDLHIEQGAPVLLFASTMTLDIEPVRWEGLPRNSVVMVRNPNLKDLGFQRILDPHSCFQQISQFIGGVMPGRQMPMVQLDDKHMVQKKGFDIKYSFRKRPTGK